MNSTGPLERNEHPIVKASRLEGMGHWRGFSLWGLLTAKGLSDLPAKSGVMADGWGRMGGQWGNVVRLPECAPPSAPRSVDHLA